MISMNYPCSEKDALMLSALAVQAVYGGDSANFTPGALMYEFENTRFFTKSNNVLS